jgi:hypothetical protein
MMRKICIAAATALIAAVAASNADAMCGSNLSPSRTPYSLLAPQTNVADISATASVVPMRPAHVKVAPPPHL